MRTDRRTLDLFDTTPAAADVPRAPAASRYDQLEAAFLAFDAEHPEIWDAIEQAALRLHAAGKRNYGMAGLFEDFRWETSLTAGAGDHMFKMNNNHRAFYVRRFREKYPALADFFRRRTQRSQLEPPVIGPELQPRDFDGARGT